MYPVMISLPRVGGKGAERVETRTARPARRPQRDGDDLLPVMPEVLHRLNVCLPAAGNAPYNQLNISIFTVTLSSWGVVTRPNGDHVGLQWGAVS